MNDNPCADVDVDPHTDAYFNNVTDAYVDHHFINPIKNHLWIAPMMIRSQHKKLLSFNKMKQPPFFELHLKNKILQDFTSGQRFTHQIKSLVVHT